MKHSRTLNEWLEDYVLYKSIRNSSAYQMRRTVGTFCSWLQRPPTTDDLNDRDVSQWIAAMQKCEAHAPTTIAGHRTKLLCLWRFVADRGDVDPPHRVRDAKRPEPAPIAWTLDELRAVISACGLLDGHFRSGSRRALYCSTLVKFCYETGLRRSDVWRTDRRQVRPDGSIVLRQRKTGGTHCPRIREDTYIGMTALVGNCPLACPFASASDWYRFWKNKVIAVAGVRHGAMQQIRRTGATHLAIEHPHAVQRYLGHKTPTVQRHYVDQSIAKPQSILPPDIGAA